jgi:biopolymer transport protein TolR
VSATSNQLRKKRDFVHMGSRPNSDINVTPLVDVVLVLLIIFMVVTPLLEKDIDIKVPDTEQAEEPDEVPQDQLVVGIDAQNNLSINSEKIPWGPGYVDKLKRQLAAKAGGDKLVFFMAEEKSSYGKVIEALDGAREAGAQILGMMTELQTPTAQK